MQAFCSYSRCRQPILMDSSRPVFDVDPPEALQGRILRAVRQEESRLGRRRWLIHSFLFSVLIVAFGFAARQLWTDLHATGFFTYASLIASDERTVLENAPSFLATLSESFPDIEFTACLALLFGALATLRHYYRGLAHVPAKAPAHA